MFRVVCVRFSFDDPFRGLPDHAFSTQLIPVINFQTNCACHEVLVQYRSSSIAQGQGVSTLGCSLAAALADEPSWLYDLTCYRGNILSSHQLPVHHCDSMLRNVYLTKSSDKFSWYYRGKYFKKYYRFFPCKPQLCRKIRPTSYKKSLKDIQNAIFCIIILDK